MALRIETIISCHVCGFIEWIQRIHNNSYKQKFLNATRSMQINIYTVVIRLGSMSYFLKLRTNLKV